MQQKICPLDGQPCAPDCPDRYRDEPAGGCVLTTAREQGGKVVRLDDATAAIVFTP